ncbi:hypothetical protein E7T06_15830 [Deinococcus sp. Arct2-2]|uniref:hypothetical protein n=1 Tax=Deinococcus sp. Arct2-2 TaxID=2568653 RepID=UPI0010A3A276|nr:hypothetical protein [Deinococcus sp. Arct2-2]THF68569.1 hypothetical protein E7T06_15830 [Deinococcus sp. Arct2-2]
MKTLARTLLLTALATYAGWGTAAAQAGLTPITANDTLREQESVTVWGGLTSEFVILPGLSAGLSIPVGQVGGASVSVRGMADVTFVPLPDVEMPFIPFVGADLLFSGPAGNVTVYGGPGVGTVLGQLFWVSGTAGIRNTFGDSRWGYFGEFKGRYLFDTNGIGLLSPGTRLGLTYRF